VLIVSRGLDCELTWVEGRDVDYAELRARHEGGTLPSNGWSRRAELSALHLGHTGKPKACRAMSAVMPSRWRCRCARRSTSAPASHVLDLRRRLGGRPFLQRLRPLIGRRDFDSPTKVCRQNPDPGIWWKICADYGVRSMFSSPTAIRVLKKPGRELASAYDCRHCDGCSWPGERSTSATAHWISDGIGRPVIDNYWQTETGCAARNSHRNADRSYCRSQLASCFFSTRNRSR